ncbi:MAG: hypothetical protein SFU20_08970 [Chitinophagaceae bacterium]|nr:hypothetical protein [Chitinophagaceae bacterium]
MKKTILALAGLFAILLALTYLLIPSELSINEKTLIDSPPDALFRKLQDRDNWKNWWPDSSSGLRWKENEYTIEKILVNRFELRTTLATAQVESLIALNMADSNRAEVNWSTHLKTDLNPITRIRQYLLFKECRSSFQELLQKMSAHYNQIENVYGFPIRIEQVPFRFATAWKRSTSQKPTVADIYTMVDSIRTYIQRTGGRVAGDPMVYTTLLDPLSYEIQVAIPTETKLPESGPFTSKWFLKGGLIVVADVNGGPATIEEAMHQVDLFVSDQRRGRVAIPFQGLSSDRRVTTDTALWRTRIYFPII